jgi:photosystem II stability/assembly factor-like uncharacterized protein
VDRSVASFALLLLVLFLAAIGEGRAHQPHDPVRSIAASPDFAADRTLLVATRPTTQVPGSRFLLKSEDGGASWRAVHRGLPNAGVPEIAFSPDFARDGLVLAGTCGAGLFRSEDRGESWRRVAALDAGEACIGRILFSGSFAGNGRVYLLTSRGELLRSADGAASWQGLELPGGARAMDLRIHPGVAGERLLAGTDQGLLLSEDGGRSWTSRGLPPGETRMVLVAGAPGRDGLLVAAGKRSLWRSRDGGVSWKAIAVLEGKGAGAGANEPGKGREGVVMRAPVTGIAFLPAEEEPLLVVSTASEIWIGERTGERWRPSREGLREHGPGGRFHYQRMLALPPRTLLVAGWEGVHRSEDAGRSWRHLELIRPYSTRGVLFSPDYSRDGTIFASTYGSGVLVSRDRGRSWKAENLGLVDTRLDPLVSSFSSEEGGGAALFVGNYQGVWRRSAEGSWEGSRPVPHHQRDGCRIARYEGRWGLRNYIRTIAVPPSYPQPAELLVGGESGCIDLSEDGGESWRMVHDAGPPITIIRYLRGDGSAAVYLAGLAKGGMLVSRDSGRSWKPLETFPSHLTVSDIEAVPGGGGEGAVYAATLEQGVFLSQDGGARWSSTGGPEVSALALEISPGFAEDGLILAGTNGGGVLLSTDRGKSWSASSLPVAVALELALSPAFAEDGTVLCGTPRGPYLSQDRGKSWRAALDRGRYEERSERIRYGEGWELDRPPGASGDAVMQTRSEGAELEFIFYGSAVSWIGGRGPDHTVAELWVDGQPEGAVDLHAATRESSLELFRTRSRPLGEHTLRIRVSRARPAGAGPARATVDAFDVWLRGPERGK